MNFMIYRHGIKKIKIFFMFHDEFELSQYNMGITF
jgi:hypothetical protein